MRPQRQQQQRAQKKKGQPHSRSIRSIKRAKQLLQQGAALTEKGDYDGAAVAFKKFACDPCVALKAEAPSLASRRRLPDKTRWHGR